MAEINRSDIVANDVFTILDRLDKKFDDLYNSLEKIKKSARDSGANIKTSANVDFLRRQISDLTATQKKLNDENKKVVQSLKDEIDAMKKLGDTTDKTNDKADKLTKTLNNGAKALGAFFAVDKIKDFIGEVVRITSEFQKFSAVLTNTLGSKSAANKALADIKDFAATTPYGVAELTQSFVKLANTGFKPTVAEMTKLGDLASSQGKSFDQLTEGIIDAQTGQFERLKEFGIRAQKEGDKVKFTFKGVKQEVDFTSDSIQKYILSLGDAAGVSGGMEAISKTLGGQISNLGDSWDAFLVTLGEGNNGILSGTVSLLSKALAIAKDLVTTTDQANASKVAQNAGSVADKYKSLDEAGRANLLNKIYSNLLQTQIDIAKTMKIQQQYANGITIEENDYLKGLKLREESLKESISLIKFFKDEQEAQKQKSIQDAEEEAKARYEAFLKMYKKLQQAAKDISESIAEEDMLELQKQADAANKYFEEYLYGKEKVKEAIEVAEEGLTDFELAEIKKRVEQNKQAEKQKLEDKKKFQQQAFQFALDLDNAYFDNQISSIQREQQSLKEKYDYDIELAGDNKDAKDAITKKYNEQDKKLKTEQANREKQAAVVSIILNTARGIIAALASVPPNIPLSIGIGVIGGIQLATAKGVSLPAFKDGTEYSPEGPAIVGEQGPELMIEPSGNVKLSPATASIMELEEGTKIIPYEDTLKMLAFSNMQNSFMDKRPEKSEELKILKQIDKSIRNQPGIQFNWGKDGLEKWLKNKETRTRILNDLYR